MSDLKNYFIPATSWKGNFTLKQRLSLGNDFFKWRKAQSGKIIEGRI